jgi:CBS domain-containing protein
LLRRRGGRAVAQTIQDVMTPNPTVLDAKTPLDEAARAMRDGDIGDVLVSKDGQLCGIVTDRDIVVRGVAEITDVRSAKLGDVCSRDLTTISPTDSVDKAAQLMREKALRRLPVVRDGEPVGVVSMGDLAIEKDPSSALADVSAAPGNT